MATSYISYCNKGIWVDDRDLYVLSYFLYKITNKDSYFQDLEIYA